MVLFDCFACNFLSFIVAIVLAYITYSKWSHSHWKKRGIPYLEPKFFFGNTKAMILKQKSLGEQFLDMHQQLKAKGAKYGGAYFFSRPTLLLLDPEIIKNVMIRDFEYFRNRGLFIDADADPLTGNLLNLENEEWRNLRAKLTPTFTSGKMKMMFETLVNCSNGLKEMLDGYATSQTVVDIKEVLACFTTDVIGSCAFGVECNTMKNPNSPFRVFGKQIFEPPTLKEKLRPTVIQFFPKKLLKLIKFKETQPDVEDFFMNIVKEVVNQREKDNIFRKDFMHLLLQLKNRGQVSDDEMLVGDKTKKSDGTFTMEKLAAQVFVFFIGGFETSATTMTFALYELAENPDIQEKLRKEINAVLKKHNNQITYEAIKEMEYLDKVINETFRKHPPLPVLPRVVTKPYKLPDTDIVIPVGMRASVSVWGLHSDPEYYPNPETFDPERFTEENKAKRPPCTFLPFGEGPRQCIGLRFGLMQTKVGLATIIQNYRITLNKKTKVPFVTNKYTFVNSVRDGIWLDISKI